MLHSVRVLNFFDIFGAYSWVLSMQANTSTISQICGPMQCPEGILLELHLDSQSHGEILKIIQRYLNLIYGIITFFYYFPFVSIYKKYGTLLLYFVIYMCIEHELCRAQSAY